MTACPQCGYLEGSIAREWRFFVPLEPPTANELAHNKGGGRWRYAKLRDQYVLLVRAAMNRGGIPKATGRRRVRFTRLYTGRGKARDRVNGAAGMKPLLDALVRCELLVDDSEQWVDDYYHQRRDEHLSGVEVVVQEVT